VINKKQPRNMNGKISTVMKKLKTLIMRSPGENPVRKLEINLG
jgi:hypothetical protein